MLTTILSALQRFARRLSWSRAPSGWLAALVVGGLLYCLVFDANQLDRWLVPGILLLAWCLLWYSFVSLFPTAVFTAPTRSKPTASQRFGFKLRRIFYGLLGAGLAATAVGLLVMTSRLLNTWNYRSDLDLTKLQTPTSATSALPHLTRAPNGRVLLSWVDSTPDQTAQLSYADLNEQGWSTATPVASGADWFINWADFPSVIALDNQQLAAHWLRRSGDSAYAYDVMISQSVDNGATWDKPYSPHQDNTASEHGFASLYATQNGLGAIWLDGRNTLGAKPHNAMTLRSAQRLGAAPGDEPGDHSTLLDRRVCDCCQTDIATLGDTVIAVYRDRGDADVRDITVIRRIGEQWQPGRPVARDGWRVQGCPVNGPAIAVLAQAEQGNENRSSAGANRASTVGVAWYTEAAGPQVRLALSANAAASFDNAITVDDLAPIGRVDVALDDDGSAIVSWVRTTAETDHSAQLVVRRVFPGGSMEPVRVVARISAARSSGFPQMLRDRDRLVFAWTTTKTEQAAGGRTQTRTTGIATATVPLSDI